MGASPAQAPPDALEAVYRRCMEPLHERARAWFPTLEGCEEDLYQAAWASLLGNRQSIEDPETYLECAVYSAGLKELRRRRRKPIVSLSFARFRNGAGRRDWQQGADAVADRTEPLPEEHVESREDAQVLAEVLEALTPLQRQIVKLHWGLGLRRREAALFLGISEKSVKRHMEKAAPVFTMKAELARDSGWCEPMERLVVSYMLGLLGKRRAAKARDHLRSCPACSAAARAMRERLAGLAALLPPPALAASSPAQGGLARFAEAGESIRSAVSDLASGAKGHAIALLTRSPADSAATQVAAGGGLRGGGSALAAVTACLVAGGGATYCAIEGVPESLRGLAPINRSTEQRTESTQKAEEPPPVAQQPQPVPSAPAHDQAKGGDGELETEAPAAQPITESQPSPAPEGSVEFGRAASTEAPKPAPAPASGTEFSP